MENDEVKEMISDFYKEMGGNPDELHFGPHWFDGASYKVTRIGYRNIDIRRTHIDDYLDSKNESAAVLIKRKLEGLFKTKESA